MKLIITQKKLASVTAITFSFIILTLNSPAQWVNMNSGTTRSLNRVFFPSVNVGYVLPFTGPLLITVNGGTTWDSLSSLTLLGNGLFDNNICFVDDSVGFVSTHNANGNIRLYRTADMGNTWMDITPDSNLWGILKVQFLNYQRGYLFCNSAFDDRFWTTNNGGTTWTETILGFSLGSGTGSMPTMFFVNDSTGYLAGGDGTFAYRGAIAQTNDAGQNWSLTLLPQAYSLINSIHFPGKDTGYAVTEHGNVYRTANEGSTWDSVATLSTSTNADEIFFIDDSTGFVISGTNIYKTTDAGVSWSSDFSAPAGIDLLGIYFPDSTTGYVVGKNGTILKNSISSGIENLNSGEDLIAIYPNPAISELNIQNNSTQSIQFSCYNSLGEKIFSQSLIGRVSTLDISGYPGGVYFYKVTDDRNKMTKGKIIKQ